MANSWMRIVIYLGQAITCIAILSKFLLVSLACDAVLLSERIDKKEGLYVSIAMIVLEMILYGVFMIGFPLIRTRLLFMALPFVGVLIAGSICLFIVQPNVSLAAFL